MSQYNNSRNNFSENSRNPTQASGCTSSGYEQNTSSECDRDSRDGTEGRECRVAVINPKKFPVFPSLLYSLKNYCQRFHARYGHQTQLYQSKKHIPRYAILREDKLHIVGVINGFIESFGSVQVSLMAHPLRMDIIPDNFSILQEF